MFDGSLVLEVGPVDRDGRPKGAWQIESLGAIIGILSCMSSQRPSMHTTL